MGSPVSESDKLNTQVAIFQHKVVPFGQLTGGGGDKVGPSRLEVLDEIGETVYVLIVIFLG